MSNDRTSDKYIVNVNNYDVSSHVHSFHHRVFEDYNKNNLQDCPKTTLFKNPETTENRGKETTKGKEDRRYE